MTWLGAVYAPANPRAAMDVGVGMIHQSSSSSAAFIC